MGVGVGVGVWGGWRSKVLGWKTLVMVLGQRASEEKDKRFETSVSLRVRGDLH